MSVKFAAASPIVNNAGLGRKLKVVLVTNIPAPYRIPIWNRIAAAQSVDFTVIFCARKEPNREWDIQSLEFNHIFLRESFITLNSRSDASGKSRYIHNNVDVWHHLAAVRPDVILTPGFNPTFLYAFFYALWHGCKHVCMTDGTLRSERDFSRLHKSLRRFVFKHSDAFVGASDASIDLFRSYNLPQGRLFKSPLCGDNERFSAAPRQSKSFDLMFCGRFVDDKQPLFAFEVAENVARGMERPVSILFVGSGELELKMRERAARSETVISTFHGFARQSELPLLYGSSRIFLFPTKGDVWGIVANEACTSGLPIVATPFAGSVGEIIQDGVNAFVRDIDLDAWTNAVQRLLHDKELYETFSRNSVQLVSGYNYDVAAAAIINAAMASLV